MQKQPLPRAPRRRRLAWLAALILGLAWLPGEAGAWLRRADPPDPPLVLPLRGVPLALPGEAAPERVIGLLTEPTGWMPGDAAVVMIGGAFPAGAQQQRLVEALLAEGAAILELDADGARGASPDSTVAPAVPTGAGLLPDLFGGLAALRRHLGPGPVVAIGLDEAGAAALLAAQGEQALRRLPDGMAGFAAGIGLGAGPIGFASGGPMPGVQRWPPRVPLLCEALAWAVAPEMRAARAMSGACMAALRPVPGPRQVVNAPR